MLKVAASEEDSQEQCFLISNPITIVEVKTRAGVSWIQSRTLVERQLREDLFIINLDDVLTISESSDLRDDIDISTDMYRDSAKAKSGRPKITREMGYISTVR